MTIFLTEHDAARLGIEGAKPRTTRGRNTRPDLPAAGRSAATGLATLIAPKRGSGKPAWSVFYVVGMGFRMFVIGTPELDTGWHASEKAACDAAKELQS